MIGSNSEAQVLRLQNSYTWNIKMVNLYKYYKDIYDVQSSWIVGRAI